MTRPARRAAGAAGWMLSSVAALAVAAAGDVLIEALENCGLFGTGYRDRSHLTVVPILAVALAMLAVVISVAVAERRRSSAAQPWSADGDWLVAIARDLTARSSLRAIARITGTALAIALAMEQVEAQLGAGPPFGGLPLLAPPGMLILLVYTGCAVLIAGALSRCMHGIVVACETLAHAVCCALVVILARGSRAGAPRVVTAFARVQRSPVSGIVLARCHGDRAPPARLSGPAR